jgi:hypothetical protein
MFNKVKEFFKKFWGLFLAAGAFLVYIFWKYKPQNSGELASDVRSTGDQFADAVDTVRAGEQAALDAEAKRHADEAAEIKRKYEEKRDQLDTATKVEADKIVEKYGNDPVALAEKLSEATGFKIIMPKD